MSKTTTFYTVPTIAELKALTTRPAVVELTGIAAGIFNWYAADATTADDGTVVQCTSGPVGRYIRVYNGPLDVRWFGATGDGSTDDTAAIMAALAAAGTGGIVLAPIGDYKITSTVAIPSHVTLMGMGQLGTEFFATTNITLFEMTGTLVAPRLNAFIANCVIRGNGLGNTSAVGVSTNATNRCGLINVRFLGHYAAYKGIDAFEFYARDCWVDGTGADQSAIGYWLLSGGLDADYNNTHFFFNCNAMSVSLYGLRIENGQGSQFTNCQYLGGVHGIYIGDPTSAGTLQFMFFNGCQTDSTSSYGIFIKKGGATSVSDIQFVGQWAGLAGTANIYLQDLAARNVTFTSTTAENSQWSMVLDTCSGIAVTGLACGNYDAGNSGAPSVVLANSTNNIFVNVIATPSSLSMTPGVGWLENGTSDLNVLVGGNMKGYTVIGASTTVSDVHDPVSGLMTMYTPVLRFGNNAGAAMLQLGGATSAASAVARVSADVAAVLADNSGYTSMRALNFIVEGGRIYFETALGSFLASADGIFTMLNNAGTAFGRLQLGGTTSSFPAIAPVGSALASVLADNSAYTQHIMDNLLTAAPAGSSQATFKIGSIVSGAVVVDTTRSVYAEIGGAVVKLIIST
jgi:hypothetical protein